MGGGGGEAPLCRWRGRPMLCCLMENTEPFPRPHWPLFLNKKFGAGDVAHSVEYLPSKHKALIFLEALNSIAGTV